LQSSAPASLPLGGRQGTAPLARPTFSPFLRRHRDPWDLRNPHVACQYRQASLPVVRYDPTDLAPRSIRLYGVRRLVKERAYRAQSQVGRKDGSSAFRAAAGLEARTTTTSASAGRFRGERRVKQVRRGTDHAVRAAGSRHRPIPFPSPLPPLHDRFMHQSASGGVRWWVQRDHKREDQPSKQRPLTLKKAISSSILNHHPLLQARRARIWTPDRPLRTPFPHLWQYVYIYVYIYTSTISSTGN
jgi:hypothetical protein